MKNTMGQQMVLSCHEAAIIKGLRALQEAADVENKLENGTYGGDLFFCHDEAKMATHFGTLDILKVLTDRLQRMESTVESWNRVAHTARQTRAVKRLQTMFNMAIISLNSAITVRSRRG